MVNSREHIYVNAESIKAFAIRAFMAVGVSQYDAEITTNSMLQAALRGEGDHGMRLVATWINKIKAGGTNPKTPISIIQNHTSTALIDANAGIGAVAAAKAMEMAIEKASSSGAAFVGVRNSNSYANAKYYPMIALESKMIGFTFSNSIPLIPPYGGLTPKSGTNPIAFTVPAKNELPVILDMSTATMAFERLRVYASLGKKVPPGAIISSTGHTIDDPTLLEKEGFLKGAVLQAAGGYKGFGLSLMINLMTGVLFDGAFMDDLREFTPANETEKVSFVLGAININHFMPYDRFIERMDEFILSIKDSDLASGVDQIYLPGEKGSIRYKARLKEGIPLDSPTIETLSAMAKELGIEGIPGKS